VAYSFVAASTHHMLATLPGTPATTGLSFACWYNSTSQDLSQGLIGYGDKDNATADRMQGNLQGNVAGDPIRYVLQSGGSSVLPITSTAYVANTWEHAAWGSASPTSHAVWRNGAGKGTSATNLQLAAPDRIDIGRFIAPTPTSYFSGTLAYPTVFSGLLTDAQVLQLAQGRHPRNIGATLVYCWPWQTNGALTDEVASLVLTLGGGTGTPTWVANFVKIWTASTNTGTDGVPSSIEGVGFNDTKGAGKLELCDNATYASATKVLQTTSSWDDDTISFTYNLGGLTPGSLWLFATNSDGQLSAAFPVTVSVGTGVAFGSVFQSPVIQGVR
jgi:hypothetical protein